MKRMQHLSLAVLLASCALPGLAVNFNATEDLDLANTANWAEDPTGKAIFFRALTDVYPNGYTLTASDNVRFGRTELGASQRYTFDIKPYTMICQDNDSMRSLAVNDHTIVWKSGTLCTSNTAGTAVGQYTVQVKSKNIAFIVDGPDAIVRSHMGIRDGYDCRIVITNGAQVSGQVYIQGYSNNLVHITGPGTKVDYLNNKISVATSRSNSELPECENRIIIDNGAIVTNFSGLAVGDFLGSYSTLDADGLHMPLDTKLSFSLGARASTRDCTIRLKNAVMHLNNATIGKAGTNHCLDLGTNTIVCNTGSGVSPIGDSASNCRLWLHDGAIYSNFVTQVQVGYRSTVHGCKLQIDSGSSFYGEKSVAVGYNNSTTNTLILSDHSKIKTSVIFIGTESTDSTVRQRNEVLASDSTLDVGGVTFAGYDNRLVLSNSTVSMESGKLMYAQNYKGGQNRFELYGTSQLLAKSIQWGNDSRIKFEIPEDGYPADFVPIQTTGSFEMGGALFEFDFKKFAKKISCPTNVTLATFPAYNFTPREANATQIAQWAAIVNALPDGCKLIRDDAGGKLQLKVMPRRGLAVIVR